VERTGNHISFMALSLDETGKPIPVVNSDPATWLLLRDRRDMSVAARDRARRDVRAFMRAYPVGLFVDRLGPLVANDAYASHRCGRRLKGTGTIPRAWSGAEVNLFMLGLAKEISTSNDRAYVNELRDALRRTSAAVEASGLKHNGVLELRNSGRTIEPIRYEPRQTFSFGTLRSRCAIRVVTAPNLRIAVPSACH
jgi:hypothetical protein